MDVLKFGGTSVGSAENINKVISILDSYSKNSRIIVVVSAVGGITDKLLKAAELALNKDENYIQEFESIVKKHHAILETLIPLDYHLSTSHLDEKLGELRSLLDGIFLINELSPKSSDRLVSFGELLSSYIIAETMKSRNID